MEAARNYIFSFEADGSQFRINALDELRPESRAGRQK